MKAMIYRRYGGPDVVAPATLPRPEPGPGELLIRVRAASVTTADWRLRAAAFPGIMQIPGRLMFGLTRPRNPILGMDFAGEVAATGPGVEGFATDDRVFGFSGGGAHAEYLTVKAAAAVAPIPAGLDFAEAAALPFGGLAALTFLRDFGGLQPGQRVLILGASGGVGAYAVQIARHIGADVTAVASAANHALLRDLGAARTIDYRQQDPLSGGPYDLILDTVGATGFAAARRALTPNGLFLPLNFGLREMLQALRARLTGGRRIRIAVNEDKREDLDTLADLVHEGALRPVIDSRYPLEALPEAYLHVESRHRRGAVILDVAPDTVPARRQAC